MTESWVRALEQLGFPAFLVVVIGFAVWRGVRAAAPHVIRWTDQIVTHWIRSAESRNVLLEKLVSWTVEHELRDAERHRTTLERIDAAAEHQRAEIRVELDAHRSAIDATTIAEAKKTRATVRAATLTRSLDLDSEDLRPTPPPGEIDKMKGCG